MVFLFTEEPPNEEDVCTSHVHVQSPGVISEGNVENSPKPLDESSSVITEENLVKDTEETEDQIFYSSGSCGPDIVEEVPAKEKESKTKQQSTLFQLFKSLKSTSSKQSKSGDYFYTNLDQINTADYEGDNTFLAPADQRTSSSETFARSTSVKSSDDESEHGDGESSDSAFLETSSSPTSSGQEPSFNTLLQTIDSHENDSSDIEIEEFTTPKFFKNKNAAKMEPTTSYKKSSTLQTSLTKTSIKDCKYPFAKSKNIKIYTEEEIENATGFEKQRRLFWNETAERMSKDPESRNWKKDAIHGAIDVHWTLAKSSVLRQEIRALESKLEQFNDTYEDIERNVLEKCNLYRNEDRVTAADRLVKNMTKK